MVVVVVVGGGEGGGGYLRCLGVVLCPECYFLSFYCWPTEVFFFYVSQHYPTLPRRFSLHFFLLYTRLGVEVKAD